MVHRSISAASCRTGGFICAASARRKTNAKHTAPSGQQSDACRGSTGKWQQWSLRSPQVPTPAAASLAASPGGVRTQPACHDGRTYMPGSHHSQSRAETL